LPGLSKALGLAGVIHQISAVSERYSFMSNAARRRTTHPATAHAVVSINERQMIMAGKMDQIKRRIKEATGVITDDDRLKREGKLDQLTGRIKEKAAEKMRTVLTGNPSAHQAK
jgi:uncharacterized protein YjbJ (UPF0337 family)